MLGFVKYIIPMTSGRQVPLFLLACATVLTVMIAGCDGVRRVSQHYGWDGCHTVDIGHHTARVCDR